MIRLVIADDHTIVREGLKQLLTAAGDIEVVGEAQNGHEVMERVRGLEFDLLLLDMSMPGKSGIELIRQVRAEKPKLRILILSMHEEHQYAVRAIRAGAAGYLTKDSASRQLVEGSGRSSSPLPSLSSQAMPVRLVKLCASHSAAAVRPRSSSMSGRRSAAIRRAAATVPSSSVCIAASLRPTSGAVSPRFSRSQLTSILSAVSDWPSSS